MIHAPFSTQPAGLLAAADLTVVTVVMVAAAVGAFVLLFLFLVRNFLYIARPNEALIFTGRKRGCATGSTSGPWSSSAAVRSVRGRSSPAAARAAPGGSRSSSASIAST